MQKEAIEKIEDEIVKKTTMPNNLKEKTRKEIFLNILLAIGIIVYFIFLILGSIDSVKVSRTTDFRIFSLVLLFTSITLFEVAYKKDSVKLAINGIEVLLVAIVTLFLPYIVFELDDTHQKYYILSMSLIAVYYIIKSIIISKKAKNLYEKKESDIKEIIKKENKNANILDEDIDNNEKVEIKVTPKKRGRPKKETAEPKQINKKKENKKEVEKKKVDKEPKKRGRPRKAVVSK